MKHTNQTLNKTEKKPSKVVFLDEHKYRKELRKDIKSLSLTKEARKEFEITIVVVRYIYRYMPNKPENELDLCNYELNMEELFENNAHLFTAAFFDILKYWGIEIHDIHEYFLNNEFKLFPTIDSICTFVEGALKMTASN
ncbi:hypothetical protein CN918_32540 [Priestia megaterium]|nr:hypothetical protein CN918_32540 [Priestia megaterium]